MSFSVNQPFHWMDSGIYQGQPLEPLYRDEALAAGMQRESAVPIIHLWVYDQALYLGRRDARLPHLEQALHQFGQDGFGCVLRSSGGACVPLDAGVLNIAWLLPDTAISIDAFFAFVADMLQVGLRDYGELEFGEVVGSYCAGEYDFSLHGKKIGGMAQRRTRYGSILQICINIEERPRGEWMERFYALAGLDEMEAHKPIPGIVGSTVGSIAGLTGKPTTVDDVKARLFAAIRSQWPVISVPFSVEESLLAESEHHLSQRLQLFSFTAKELAIPQWRLPK
ncbi:MULTISPECIES: lipoate--protein ligase family protein [Brevibacillus]|uniref:Octanoyl-[GcvH]:protein N-octanoyltransferase n=1 Tax=Brevibacillus parabrevis TaxID=54914 RepID=A0A4Y3PK76_BREPA|nr:MULTISPECIES: lipoate--protein ligase family protein [Brevibacillus]MBU8711316.1 lipoate--protein ligase family protein [Brevibacillus parabrevis]MDH6350056.1 octanoyl-[GcvH]:protein N-octanoyltransferase [Brevibacillus sp. 1238]MDR4999508.1 lipoate--protein ligase family protein [Brevibacillus parabrevis]NRQ53739.1 lipoate--protein ligase family protein [Brevibacillus sp. HD1.4A]RNB94380.1 lipoate--protein ligase family protein [Brevibacillus parabrevis]